MGASTILAVCVAYAAFLESQSAALAAVRQRQNLSSISDVTQSAANSGGQQDHLQHRLEKGLADHVQVAKERHSRTKMHFRSVLVSEVGIVHKTEYWGKIQLGSPQEEFTVIFDTGSGNLILPSTRCSSVGCSGHKKYDPKVSNTSVHVGKLGLNLEENPDQKKEATIHFGTGSIHGQFYQDRLCLAPESACFNANFIGTDYESDDPFSSCAFDGIMGLGFKDLSMGDGFNMLDDVVSQHSLPHNQFSVFLKDHESGSEISFGGYKRSQVASEVVWAPVTRESYWQIGIDDVTFNNKKTGLCTKCQVAVDTGTSMMAGPSDVVEQLGSQLDVKLDCSNFHDLPLLGFALGDTVLNLMPDDYISRVVTHVRSICTLSLMTLDVPPPKGPLFIFGDPFLRRFLTIYDRDGPKVGFAVAKHDGITSSDVNKLIGKTGQAPGDSKDEDNSEAELLNLHSSVLAAPAPTESLAGALRGSLLVTSALTTNTDWDSRNAQQVATKKSSKKRESQTGMLQTMYKESELVTVSLSRAVKPR